MRKYALGADQVARTALRLPLAGWSYTVTQEGVSVLWKAVKSPDPNGYHGWSQKGGENERYRVGEKGEFLRHDTGACYLGVGICDGGFGAEGGT